MRLLCDEMLQRLCRWLRAAGYDTALAPLGAADREVMRVAVTDRRLLITRDREFLDRRGAASRVFHLPSADIEIQVVLLRDRLGIDWLHRPFSRCLLCNTVLELVPDDPALLRCPRCDKLYWEGSHVRRMRDRLAGWRSPGRAPGSP